MKDQPYKLSDARDNGSLVLVRCGCRRKHHYQPSDFIELFGNLSVLELPAAESLMRCAACGSSEFITVRIVHPTAAERVGIKMRRLAEIRMVRKVIWEDDA